MQKSLSRSRLIISDEDLDYTSTVFGILAICQSLESLDSVLERVSVGDQVLDTAHLLSCALAFILLLALLCLSVQSTALSAKGATSKKSKSDGIGVCITEDTNNVDFAEGGRADGEGLDGVTHSDEDHLSSGLSGEDTGLNARRNTSAFEDNVEAFGKKVERGGLNGESGIR